MARVKAVSRTCSSDLPRLLLAVAARSALWTVFFLAAWAVLPAALGWQVTTVVSDSMRPGIWAGDVVAAHPSDGSDVRPGQVLLVEDPDHADRLRLHRLQRVTEDGALQLRGDANPAPDRTPVSRDAVHGVGVLRYPLIGLPAMWIRDGEWSILGSAAAGIAALALGARADARLRAGAPCNRCGAPRWTVRDSLTTRTTPPGLLAAPVAVIALALVSATGATAAFSGTTTSLASLSSDERFTCFTRSLDAPSLAWDFDEARGPVADRSGNGRGGALLDGPTRNYAVCGENPSMHFGETTSSPRISTTTATAAPSTFTVEAWFRTDRPGGRILGFSSEQTAASAWKDRHLYVTASGQLAFGVQGSNEFRYAVTANQRVDDGRWHHVVGTFTAGAQTIWVDGVKAASRSDNRAPKPYDGFWRVGRESLDPWPGQPAEYAFRGDIDTVRVYDRVLDAATIAAHHDAGR
jgi:signal peptidase I